MIIYICNQSDIPIAAALTFIIEKANTTKDVLDKKTSAASTPTTDTLASIVTSALQFL